MSSPSELLENFFRHEHSKLIAVLSCRIGSQHIEEIEDAVQFALMRALETWTSTGIPENSSAWLYRVAHNHLLGQLRQKNNRRNIIDGNAIDAPTSSPAPEIFFPQEIEDSLLRMLFVCCDSSISNDSQLALALKTLCGFNVREISIRLFTTEANVYKRLKRARNRLQKNEINLNTISSTEIYEKLPSIRSILYLLFTEGYLSSHSKIAIRKELCDEAIRLTEILSKNPITQTPETFALLALMYLQAARIEARIEDTGLLVLLENQDRSKWDQKKIQLGIQYLAKSADGKTLTRYHLEAAIAAEHSMASSFTKTRWDKIAENYSILERITNSPLHRLNQSIAIAEAKGPQEALDILKKITPPAWLAESYIWHAVSADLNRRCGIQSIAKYHTALALNLAPTPAIKLLLKKRLQ